MADVIQWDGIPEQLEANTMAYLERVDDRIGAAINQIVTLLQSSARTTAPWVDRSGDAREGLGAAGLVDLAARDIVRIYLFHTASYGPYLERSRGGKYAVIMPTLERLTPSIWAILESIFK
jgi:hypothetical protein